MDGPPGEALVHGDGEGHDHNAQVHDPSHGEGHHHPTDPVDVSMGACLLGFVTFIMALFYLVNHSDKDIQTAAYGMISLTISIFCAVLTYSAICTSIDGIFHYRLGLPVRFTLFILLWGVVQFYLFEIEDATKMAAISMLGAHLIGFAAAESFGMLQRMSPFADSVLLAFSVAVLALAGFLVLRWVVWQIRESAVEADGVVTEMEKHFMEMAEDCEDDSCAFCLGYLLAEGAKFAVSGQLAPLHGHLKGHRQEEVSLLMLCSCGFLAAVVLSTLAFNSARRRKWASVRYFSLLQQTSSMSAAWSLLFSSQWQWFALMKGESESQGVMILAFAGTMVAIAVVFVLDYLADMEYVDPKSLRAIIACFSITVGLSWETAFNSAQHALTDGFIDAEFLRVVMSVCLVLIVLPAWRFYILPRAVEAQHEGLQWNRGGSKDSSGALAATAKPR